MIKASELRIGNMILVDVIGGLPQVHYIMAQDIVDISNGRITLASVGGISITPEILKQCGFNDGYLTIEDQHISFYLDEKTAYLMGQESVILGQSFSCKCEFVHQLQNLYFALTGEELKIEL